MTGSDRPASSQAAAVLQRRPGLLAWLVLTPLLAWLILFVIVPTIMLVLLSLGEQKGLGTVHFTFTLKNYVRALDWTWLKILIISVGYAVVTTGICMVIGFPTAYFIGRSSEPLRNVLITLVMIPLWTSFLIRTYAWITILSKDGILNAFLVSARIIPEPIGILYTPFAAVLGLGLQFPALHDPAHLHERRAPRQRRDRSGLRSRSQPSARLFTSDYSPHPTWYRRRRAPGLCSLDCHVRDHQSDGRRRPSDDRRCHLQTVYLRPQSALWSCAGLSAASHFLRSRSG